MDYEKRIQELRAKGFSVEEMEIVIGNEAKDERMVKIGERKDVNTARVFSRESWRSEPATSAQKNLLAINNVKYDDKILKGDATALIDESKKKAGVAWRWK